MVENNTDYLFKSASKYGNILDYWRPDSIRHQEITDMKLKLHYFSHSKRNKETMFILQINSEIKEFSTK